MTSDSTQSHARSSYRKRSRRDPDVIYERQKILRLEAMRLAVQSSGSGAHLPEVMKAAESFLKFLDGKEDGQ